MKEIPIIDANDPEFKDNLEFALWTTGASSDYRNDRERPYNGQAHTDEGIRGKTLVRGLTMRDIKDCMIQGFLSASCDEKLQRKVKEIHKDFQGTEHASDNSWRPQDVYKIKEDIDPIAVIQNALCFVEDMMGIFPNVDKTEINKTIKKLLDKGQENE